MSDDNFIARWSRLKRETDSEKRRAEKPSRGPPEARPEPPAAASAQPSTAPGETQGAATPPFDPATLPSIDSIGAGTDIRAFLQTGVPAELMKAALHRAWTTDPAIRDFIEVAENQWDFTDPASIPGFGALKAGDEIGELASQAMGKPPEVPQPVDLAGEREESRPLDTQPAFTATDAAPAPPEREGADEQSIHAAAASQHQEPAPDASPAPRRKGHGTAMPR
jgi:Protein of unknown function (DUF3306)